MSRFISILCAVWALYFEKNPHEAILSHFFMSKLYEKEISRYADIQSFSRKRELLDVGDEPVRIDLVPVLLKGLIH